MKTVIKTALFCFFTLLLSGDSQGQTKTGLIETIRKDFQHINIDTTLKKKTLQDEEFLENMPDGGGELTGYYRNDSIVKIVEWIGLSYGNRTREFYFTKSQLFFVYEKFESFISNDTTGEVDHSKIKTTFEGRYYFNNNKLIEQKTLGKRTFEEESFDSVKELQGAAKEDIRLLRHTRNN
jgi:hypothetical protein